MDMKLADITIKQLIYGVGFWMLLPFILAGVVFVMAFLSRIVVNIFDYLNKERYRVK